MITTRSIQIFSTAPRSCGRIKQFRTVQPVEDIGVVTARGGQNFSISQERCRVTKPARIEVAGDAPCSCDRIVKLRAIESETTIITTVAAATYQDFVVR